MVISVRDVGLTVLHDPVNPVADIIFVHGLQGHPRDTWACKAASDAIQESPEATGSSHRGIRHLFSRKLKSGSSSNPKARKREIFWPLDLLPEDCGDARIMTWGYDSKLTHFFNGSSNQSNIFAHARDLLYTLERKRLDCQKRSLIFVAHSLGGIIVKEVLWRAATDQDSALLGIYTSTRAVLFLGTPHRGSSKAESGEVIRKIVSASGFGTNDKNIRALHFDSSELENVHERFMRLKQPNPWPFEVRTFQEAKGMTGVGLLRLAEKVVDDFSSSLDGTEHRQTINANHMAMCRYSSKHEDGYEKVVGGLQHFLSRARDAENFEQTQPSTAVSRADSPSQATAASSTYSFNDIDRLCITLFSAIDIAEYKAVLPRRIDGTCSWIFKTPQYHYWFSTTNACLLWISGHSGSGKTILSAYLLEYLSMLKSPLGSYQTVCYFFCDDKIESQRDGKAILRSLIFQIITSRRKLIRYVKSAYDIQGPHLVENFNELWRIFTTIASDKRVGPIIVIVDAIDECEESTRSRFLEGVSALINKAQSTANPGPPGIKFLVTSRPLLGRRYTANLLEIEDVIKGIEDDLRLVIQIRVDEIARRTKCKPETRSYLEQALYSKADQTFLWVTLVLHILERSFLASQKDFRRIIDNLPQGLVATYEGFLYNIPAEYQVLATKLLHFIVGSRRPLSLEELQILLALQDGHKTLAEVEEDYQPNIRDTIEGILGPLVRISSSQVNLVHQSLKEYLFDLSSQKENPLSTTYGTSPDQADMLLANTCMSYLHLDEFKRDLFSEYESGVGDSPVSLSTQSPRDGDNESFLDPFALADDQILRDPEIVESEACKSIVGKYKLFDYSAMYWARHFSSCSEICSERLQALAIALSETNDCAKLSWLRYYWFHAVVGLEFPLNFNSFVIACFFSHFASIGALLENEPQIDHNTVGCGLYWAARMGHEGVVCRLLQRGVLPNPKISGQTPLAAAAQFGHLQVVKLLLAEDGTDVNCTNHAGRTPLSIASGNGHAEIVARLLCHNGVDPDNSDSVGWTPLFWAIGGKHLDIVRLLAANNRVDVNHVDKRGRNALSWAAEAGENELVKYLLTYSDLDVQRKDIKGRTALSWAAENGHLETISILRQSKRINMSDKDMEGRNAISWACSRGHHLLLAYLIKYDREGVDEEDESGWTPLAWALERNAPKTVEVLLGSGLVNVNRKDRSGRSPLYWAAAYGYANIVRILINVEDVETDTKDNGGRTPLLIAQTYGHAEVIGVLEGSGK